MQFVDITTGKLDMFKFCVGLLEYDERKWQCDESENLLKRKRPYLPRRVYKRRDPKKRFGGLIMSKIKNALGEM